MHQPFCIDCNVLIVVVDSRHCTQYQNDRQMESQRCPPFSPRHSTIRFSTPNSIQPPWNLDDACQPHVSAYAYKYIYIYIYISIFLILWCFSVPSIFLFHPYFILLSRSVSYHFILHNHSPPKCTFLIKIAVPRAPHCIRVYNLHSACIYIYIHRLYRRNFPLLNYLQYLGHRPSWARI